MNAASIRSPRRVPVWVLVLLSQLCFCYLSPANAHAGRENYVWLNVEMDYINGRFEINKNDLIKHLAIDLDKTEADTLEELRNTAPEVQKYLNNNFSLSIDGQKMRLLFQEANIVSENEKYVQYPFRVNKVPNNDLLYIRNTIFLTETSLEIDPLHRSLVLVDYNKFRGLDFGSENTALVFGPHLKEAELNVADPPGILIWEDFFKQGLLHIWIGLDHMLFLFVLLLTAVLLPRGKEWIPVPRIRDGLFNLLKIITIFTISHSITLGLAVFGLVTPPAVLVEVIIALSIAVVALNNILRYFKSHTWILIFIFGLIHGLGFASALGELQFRNVAIYKVLLMFNVGVEIGQIIIACLVFPVLYFARRFDWYRTLVMPALSLIAALIACFWMFSRLGWLN